MTRREHSTRVEPRTFTTPNGTDHIFHRAICACGWTSGDNSTPDGARFAGKYHRITVAERARDARPQPEPAAPAAPAAPIETIEPTAPTVDEPQDEADTDEPIEPAPEWDHWLSLTNDERAAHMARGNLANINDMRTRASTLETVVHQAYRDAQTPQTPPPAMQQGQLAI